jgi:hypothetical protein
MAKSKPSIVKSIQPSAKLEIDGRKYELVYDYNAIAEAEIETGNGVNLLHGIAAFMLRTMSALQLRGLLYAALKPRQPEITMQQTGALIRIDTMQAISAAINEAWGLAMPEAEANPPGAAGEKAEPPSGQ